MNHLVLSTYSRFLSIAHTLSFYSSPWSRGNDNTSPAGKYFSSDRRTTRRVSQGEIKYTHFRPVGNTHQDSPGWTGFSIGQDKNGEGGREIRIGCGVSEKYQGRTKKKEKKRNYKGDNKKKEK